MRSLPLLLVTILAAVSTLEQGSDIQADRNLGKAHYEQGEYDLAASELTRVLASSQAQARDYFNAAMAYLQNGEDDRALAAFTTAQQMDPRRIDVDFGLGVLYKRQLRYPLALESFRKVVARDPNDPCTWFNIGAVAFSMQNSREATEAFERVLRMGYPVAQNFYVASLFRYATLLARQGRQEEARHSFGEFESLREKTPNAALTPSALENGKYGRIEVPVPAASPSQVPQKAPVFSPPSTMPFSDRACEGEALEPLLRRSQEALAVPAPLGLAALERGPAADRDEHVLEQRSPRVMRMDVPGCNSPDAQVLGEVAEEADPPCIAALEGALELDEEALAAERPRKPCGGIRIPDCESAARATREADESLGELRDRLERHRG